MLYDKLMRVEGIVSKQNIFDLQEAIQAITDQMLDDGFTYKDVKEYITDQLNEILGK